MCIGKVKDQSQIHRYKDKIGMANKYIAFSQYNYFLTIFSAYFNTSASWNVQIVCTELETDKINLRSL